MKMFTRAQRPAKPRPEPAKPRPEPANQWWEADWAKVRAAYPVGRQFEYLGRKMVVASYSCTDEEPCLIAEYADDRGILHKWQFTVQMLLLTAEPQAIRENK